jgi:membrane associated rhomboid family serine protease
MQYPPLAHWQRYPVTIGIALGAMAMSAWTGFGENLERGANWLMDDRFWMGEIWRPVSSCFLHGNAPHLVFNVMCLWVFGAVFEEILGSAKTFLIILFLAFGSSMAQYAFSGPGIGLSGMLFGLFGLLWVLHRKDRRFWGTMDERDVHFAIGWFFFCIAATVANIMSIANVAHGSGAILGALLGFAIAEKNKRRKTGFIALIVLSMLVIFAAASVGRKYVNFSGDVEREEERIAYELQHQGYDAIVAGKYAKAAELYAKAVAIDDSHAGWWYNLSLCYVQLGQEAKAHDALRRAAELKPDDEQIKQDLELHGPE